MKEGIQAPEPVDPTGRIYTVGPEKYRNERCMDPWIKEFTNRTLKK